MSQWALKKMVESSQRLQDSLDIDSLSDLRLPTGAQGATCCLTGEANLVEPQPDYQKAAQKWGRGVDRVSSPESFLVL